jgi:hypothetical protein
MVVEPQDSRFDFESADLSKWQGSRGAFSSGAWPERQRYNTGLRGYHGEGVLSSLAPREGSERKAFAGKTARGRLVSPRFDLNGPLMSLMVGGGGSRSKVGVRLLVDGKAVLTTHGNGSASMVPRLWNIAEWQGKQAQLEVFDKSKRSYVLVDRVRQWR